ncbi:hypothetical protein [Crocosphaera sp. Alani8]|uniref:hypothetical protein n=1 Tax=Crocosphaera sp. Alani8 TaxID=3038952 RepID=UPI00313EF1C6
MSQEKLQGEALLQMLKKLSLAYVPRTQIAIQCGYSTSTTTEDGQPSIKADLEAFYNAVLEAKGISKDN